MNMYDKLSNNLNKLINFKQIDILYLATASFAKFFEKDFDDIVIKNIKSLVKDKTLVVPTFSFDFCDKGVYSVKESSTFCGGISSKFILDKDSVRLKYNPIHNVTIWGKLKNAFDKKYTSTFGENSFFEELNNYKVGVLLIDCSFDDGVPFVHCLEDRYCCTYRIPKTFYGKIIDKDGKVNDEIITRMVKKKNVLVSATEIGKRFYNTHYVKQIKYEKSNFVYFLLKDFYKFFNPIFKKNPNIMEIKNET